MSLGELWLALEEICWGIINFLRKRSDLQINKKSDLEGKIEGMFIQSITNTNSEVLPIVSRIIWKDNSHYYVWSHHLCLYTGFLLFNMSWSLDLALIWCTIRRWQKWYPREARVQALESSNYGLIPHWAYVYWATSITSLGLNFFFNTWW